MRCSMSLAQRQVPYPPSPRRAVLAPAPAADRPPTTEATRPRTACLVNHYEYGSYVGEAIASAARQTLPVDDLIVVDDGSSGEHLDAVREATAAAEGARLIEKPNGGQLSCFEEGLDATNADLVFFLDADDAWDPTYVERVTALFAARPGIDVVYTNERRCFADGREEFTDRTDRDLGYAMVRSLSHGGVWRGQPTSCIAMRRSILDRIFPLDLARGWRTCADEALVYGSALVGAHSYFMGAPLVRYRIHGDNAFYGREYCPKDRLTRGVEVLRLVETLRRRESLPESMAHLAHHEFRTIEQPNAGEYKEYRRLVSGSNLPRHRRRRILTALWGWYRLGKRL